MKGGKFILAPDSFKGTMSAMDVCAIMETAIRFHYPDAEIHAIPAADGGEGTVDAMLAACGGERIDLPVQGPNGKTITSFYGILDSPGVDGRNVPTAVIETAAAAGLSLVKDGHHPARATTFGVGQLMRDAALRGCCRIIVGLGGSATTDLGAGAAAGAGIAFYDKAGERFVPTGETLSRIARIDSGDIPPELDAAEVIAMCDIDNPLCGPLGAAAVFGPQKGADAETVALLDAQLLAGAAVIHESLGIDVSQMAGSGAAGGMGGGMMAFFGARLCMGIEAVLDAAGFDALLPGTDMVFTGEGSLDRQSLRGKVVLGVARRARAEGVPVTVLAGDIGDTIDEIYDEGVSGVFSINRVARPYSEVRSRAPGDLALTMDNIFRLMRACGKVF